MNPDHLGIRAPRIFHRPPSVSTAGSEAIECARMAGLVLDDWQDLAVDVILAERPDGKWAAFDTGVCCPRQNGKGSIIETIELAGLFVFDEKLIVHSAHEFKTSMEAFRRLEELLAGTPDFAKRVKRVSRAHGEEGIELVGKQRVRFQTRTKSGGRGLVGDRVILDEAMIITEETMGALVPTMAAKSITGNPQLNFFGSAVDQLIHEHGLPFSRLRSRALTGDDPSLAYLEWSASVPPPDDGGEVTPDCVTEQIASSPEAWEQSNPALDRRISREYVSRERKSLGNRRTFSVERLGVGDWPHAVDDAESVFPTWADRLDEESSPLDPVWFAFDVSPSRQMASIAAAGWREDGRIHLEVIECRRGTGWLEDRLVGLLEHRPAGFVCDELGPAASMVAALAKRKVRVKTTTSAEMAKACADLHDRVVEKDGVRHIGQDELSTAVAAAAKRKLGDRWAWSRSASRGDITPLVAATLATWALLNGKASSGKPFAMAW